MIKEGGFMLVQVLVALLMVAVVVISLFCLLVFIIMLVERKSVEEATKILTDFLSSIYKALETSTVQTSANYNVLIGYNGYVIRDDIVNEYFAPLQKYWETVYYSNSHYISPNVVAYEFRAYFPLRYEDAPRRLSILVKQVAEQALTRHFHSVGISVPVDRFIAVHIHQDIVSVYIAVNDSGFREIETLRERIV